VTLPGWRLLPGERSVGYSPAWFRLLDDVTGAGPVELVRVLLDLRDGADWRPTEVAAYVSPSGTVAFPGLERRRVAIGVPPRRYRIRVQAERYRPLSQALADGVEFDAPAHNDTTVPPAPVRHDVVLLPSAAYSYPVHVRTLRGDVVDSAGDPVQDALVETLTTIGAITRQERTLTDARGSFALALRWVAPGTTASVTANDLRGHRSGTVTINVPDDLDHNQRIAIA
jgi:hypothetical protein